ncbi:uncharacterized protein B0P05DRAFT_461483 [Gilbertella persicaria]|uniref:uncharacterized protein n=1 Tax=Gilbertella persicaria TaxID=101096 RepID=UPI00221EECD6|nr:uncharacterized protein B0P05DRAFT_461483 [Gilbertella persicaria]KAI8097883.1 hypothetical protein B0P05DRAFT_461483 [Gilbertella persicaria]
MSGNKKQLIGPVEEEIRTLLSQSGDPLEAIRAIQRDYGLDLVGIDDMYPLLDLCGCSRLEIHSACLNALNKAIVEHIEKPSFQLENFYDLFNKTFPYIHIPLMQPIPMALLKKFERHIEEDIIEKLKSDMTVFDNCPMNIKQRVWKQDESFFQQTMISLLNDYHHDESLQLLALNLKPDSYQEMIEESLCSLRVDVLMNFHDMESLQECFDNVRNGSPLYADFAMVLMDPMISNFLASTIIKWLRNNVENNLQRDNLEELTNYNAKLLNLAENAPKAVANNAKVPKLDKDLKENFWNAICKVMLEEGHDRTHPMAEKTSNVILSLLKRTDIARKVFVHYLVERVFEGDIGTLHRCLPLLLQTWPTDLEEDVTIYRQTYLSFVKTMIDMIIKRYLINCVAEVQWRQVIMEGFLLKVVAWDGRIHEQMIRFLAEFFMDPKVLLKLGPQVAILVEWADIIVTHGFKDDKVK